MNSSDEAELHRLCNQLEQMDQDSTRSEEQREALKKAALALSVAFVHDLRSEIERQFESLGRPLTEAQQKHLDSLHTQSDDTRQI